MLIRSVVVLTSIFFVAFAAIGEPKSNGNAPKSFTAISPIFSQLLAHSQPTNFVPAFERTIGERYIRESVPRGETVERWTQMITVSGAKALVVNNPKLAPDGLVGAIAAGFKSSCPGTFAALGLGKLQTGSYESFAAVAGCGSLNFGGGTQSELALVVAVKGTTDYYTIQWSVRSKASATAPVIDKAAWMQRLELLGPIVLCPIVPGEKPPYPSCVTPGQSRG